MDRKEAASKLLEIADAIDKKAADMSYFVCSSCNHTVNLTSINDRRMKAASEYGDIDIVEPVTVDDKISCPVPGCEGILEYVPTDESESLYVEAADDEDDTGDIFEPVDEQDKKKKEKGKDELDLDVDIDVEKAPKEEESEEPEEKPEEKPEEEPEEPEEEMEMPEEEEAPKKKSPKKKKDKPDDEAASLPKEKKPKFEKMPKEAEDEAFLKSVAKYASW